MSVFRSITLTPNWDESDLSPFQREALRQGLFQRGQPIPNDIVLRQRMAERDYDKIASTPKLTPTQQREQYEREIKQRKADAEAFHAAKDEEEKRRRSQLEQDNERIYRLFPEQWGGIFTQEKIDAWKRQNTYSRITIYNNLWADVNGTIWYTVNSLINALPIKPGTSTKQDEDNYYDYLVPFAFVRAAWRMAPHPDINGDFVKNIQLDHYADRQAYLTQQFTVAKTSAIIDDAKGKAGEIVDKVTPSGEFLSAIVVGGIIALLGILLRG